ncbi:ATPase [Candidatus Woesearchaeota archaeon]|nr:ATPase [Candidatus Woesearchaeota archaeon]|tara:strand:- start:64546 stop:66378 length:1833 start_codon:yes stop_codon:yes gene_type:complete
MGKKEISKVEKLVPDTSVIIEGLVSKKLSSGELVANTVIIHEAVVAELEHQANVNKTIGFLGLEEIEAIKKVSEDKKFKVEFAGMRPGPAEIRHARLGEIDALIRQLAYEEGATLFTSDRVQATVGKAKNMNLIFVEVEKLVTTLKIEKYFDNKTMSVHIRENVKPTAKKGQPGKWEFVVVGQKETDRDQLKEMSREIIEEANVRKDGFVEIERQGSTIVQVGNFRIVVTRPPFSDGWEITAVRPVKKLSMADYKLSDKLTSRISEQAEGILIAGPPGHGKTTIASALAEHYAAQNKIVKTIEAPRDLMLADNITQYSLAQGTSQEIHDILLLSRPDYTIFDEMRNTNDFRLFSDLRLAGIGLAGVVHATNPIDAIQRFVGRIELGVIPQVVDTVIFIKNGGVDKVLSLKMTVKVPEGMTEADLARPVVVVTDFETGKMEYELYSYGEETVVIPVIGQSKSPARNLASQTIADEIRAYADRVDVEMISDNKCVVYVPEESMARVIGKEGKTINAIEKSLGVSIDLQPLGKNQSNENNGSDVTFHAKIGKKHVVFEVDESLSNKSVNIYVDDDYVMTAQVGKRGIIKLSRKNKIGNMITDAVNSDRIKLLI